jgi:hypothetical protein
MKILKDESFKEQANFYIFGAGITDLSDEDFDVPSEYRHKYEHLM